MLPRMALALLALISSALVYESAGLNLDATPEDKQALQALMKSPLGAVPEDVKLMEAEVEEVGEESDGKDPEEVESENSLLAKWGGSTFNFTSIHGSEFESFVYERNADKPVINFDMNCNHNFEVLLSLIHFFGGGELPYTSNVPAHILKLWDRAREFGSDIYVNAEFTRKSDRMDMLRNQMKKYNVKFGAHKNPDLWVLVTVYPTLKTLRLAAQNRWKDNERVLLVAHRFELHATEEEFNAFEKEVNPLIVGTHIREFSNFSMWKNTLGLMPLAPRYIMPTFFPYNYTHRNGTSRLHDDGWIPQLCVHGTFARRTWKPLADAVKPLPKSCPLSIKLAGIGKFPREMNSYRGNRVSDLRMNSDLDYQNFFQQCDYLLPLIGNNTMSEYYHTTLLSTAARSIGHQIPVIAPMEFKKIYPMVQGRFFDGPTGFAETVRDVAQCMTEWGN